MRLNKSAQHGWPMASAGLIRSNGMNKRNLQRTPLHHAAADAELETVVQLVELGVDVNAQDSQGWSALHFAAQSLSTDCARLLLEAGANVNARDSFGNTPLSRAVFVYQGDGDLIELLRKAGAEPNLKNNHGVSPVDLARSIANHDVAKFFTDVAV